MSSNFLRAMVDFCARSIRDTGSMWQQCRKLSPKRTYRDLMAHVYGLHTHIHLKSETERNGWLATVETGSGFGNCIMVRLGAREIVKLNNKAQKMRQR